MTDGLPMPRRMLAIAAISSSNIAMMIDSSIVNVALPTIARELNVPDAHMVMIVTGYQIVLLMGLFPLSSLGDRLGARRMFLIAQCIFCVGCFVSFFASNLWMLLAVRCLQALGAAMALAVSTGILREIYPSDQLGRGLGLNTLLITIALVAAPALGGFLLAFASWRWLFLSELPIVLIALLMSRSLPTMPPQDRPFNIGSAVLCVMASGLFGSGLSLLAKSGVHLPSVAVTIAGVAFCVVLFMRESRQANPVVPVDLLGSKFIGLSAIAATFCYAATLVMTVSLPFYLHNDLHFSAFAIGTTMMGWPIGMMITAPLGGFMSDRHDPALLGMAGIMAAMVTLSLFLMLPDHPDMLAIAWRFAACGMAFGFFFAPNARLIIGTAPRARAAAAGGVIATVRLTGQMIGSCIVALLLSAGAGAVIGPFGTAMILTLCAAVFVGWRFMIRDTRAAPTFGV